MKGRFVIYYRFFRFGRPDLLSILLEKKSDFSGFVVKVTIFSAPKIETRPNILKCSADHSGRYALRPWSI